MVTTIDQYREAKAMYEKLHSQAKKDLLARFHELANELLQIQKELKEDFGTRVAIPAKRKAVRGASKSLPPAKTAAPPRAAVSTTASPAIARLEKKVATQQRKLEEAVRAGQDTKPIKDRIYELEDELRLARE